MKAKFCSILLLSLCCASVAGAAQSAVSERYDFSKGIPSDFILIDNDGNTPSVDVTRYGFSVGTPWVSHYVEKEDNYVAASTSWYAASGTSDDWMILPQFTVADADAVVSWRAKADNAMFSDGYAVYISEGGGEISDFDKLKPLFTVAAEQAEWTFHSVSLADYVGKTVRVAFVNNSTDCSMLYVDCDLTLPWFYNIAQGHDACDALKHTMQAAFDGRLQALIHSDACGEKHCAHCQVSDCPHRRAPFSAAQPLTLAELTKSDETRTAEGEE